MAEISPSNTGDHLTELIDSTTAFMSLYFVDSGNLIHKVCGNLLFSSGDKSSDADEHDELPDHNECETEELDQTQRSPYQLPPEVPRRHLHLPLPISFV